ncbi:hypothetical protein OROMI_026456 [Orobanche minor]
MRLSNDTIIVLLVHVLDFIAAECKVIKALKLCCKAFWKYVVDLCSIHRNKSQESHDVSETSIANFVKEASDTTAFLLELYQESI